MLTPILTDLAFVCTLLTVGLAAGWLGANIIYGNRLRRIQIETWREAARKYHGLIERAYASQPQPKAKLP